MTASYYEINFFDALYIAARKYPGGVEALAARMQLAPSSLYSKLRPGIETHKLNAEEVIQILELCQDAAVSEVDLAIGAFNWRFGRVAFQIPRHVTDHEELTEQLLTVMKSEGDLAADLQEALSDNKINTREIHSLEKRIQVATESLVQLLEILKERHNKDFPHACKAAK